MNIFSYHLVKVPLSLAVNRLFSQPISKHTDGLIYSECMTVMTLGAPIISLNRFLLRQVAIFAQWENEQALNQYLKHDKFGRVLSRGWHIRLNFMREWGQVSGFIIPKQKVELEYSDAPVVAVTIARIKPFEVPRFLHWGRPVEKLVRDHGGTLLSLASLRFPNTISTFSIWKTEKEMTNMVHGHSLMNEPKRHSKAMKERERRNFHYEFATLRFKPISEFGFWNGRENYIPHLNRKTS